MSDTAPKTATAPAFDYAAWEARRARENALAAEALPLNKAALFDVLAAADICDVTVSFDGYGDSGQIESVTASNGTQEVKLPDGTIDILHVQWGMEAFKPVSLTIEAALERLAYDFLSQTHCGWENNDGAYGEFTFDVAERSISLDYNERYTATEAYSHAW